MTEEQRRELCKQCKNCDEEYLSVSLSEGCPFWHNDRRYGGCSDFCPKDTIL